MNRSRVEQEFFGQRGLTGVGVGNDGERTAASDLTFEGGIVNGGRRGQTVSDIGLQTYFPKLNRGRTIRKKSAPILNFTTVSRLVLHLHVNPRISRSIGLSPRSTNHHSDLKTGVERLAFPER
jgi:hypothetical protein